MRKRLIPPAGLARGAGAGAALALVVLLGLGRARAGETQRPAHAAAGFPVATALTGDWEASGRATGSLLIVHRRVRAIVTSGPGSGSQTTITLAVIDDLVLSTRESCRTHNLRIGKPATVVLTFDVPISPSGAVSMRRALTLPAITVTLFGHTVTIGGGAYGTFRIAGRIARSSGLLTLSFGGRGAGACTIPPTSFSVRPGHRRAIVDGEWSGTAADGEPLVFGVVAGGRAISTPAPQPGLTDQAAIFAEDWAARFGAGCVDQPSTGGAVCAITAADSSGWPVDPCLHASTSNTAVSVAGKARLALANVAGGAAYGRTVGASDATMTLTFTGPRTARGTYTQPGDPACSTTFTATAP
ncbi:MAG TPA: hypothetical protein VKV27_17165 [Solirubrobacteraceae bacterium]|nr:hypothetical protein [Solirubrobacteraceae bacterium]